MIAGLGSLPVLRVSTMWRKGNETRRTRSRPVRPFRLSRLRLAPRRPPPLAPPPDLRLFPLSHLDVLIADFQLRLVNHLAHLGAEGPRRGGVGALAEREARERVGEGCHVLVAVAELVLFPDKPAVAALVREPNLERDKAVVVPAKLPRRRRDARLAHLFAAGFGARDRVGRGEEGRVCVAATTRESELRSRDGTGKKQGRTRTFELFIAKLALGKLVEPTRALPSPLGRRCSARCAQLAALEFVEVLLGVDRAVCGGRFCCRY